MYLHLGQDTVVRLDEIVGIFDMDTSTISKHTRQFLADAEKGGRIFNVSMELPKSFVVCLDTDGTETVYISQISSTTPCRILTPGPGWKSPAVRFRKPFVDSSLTTISFRPSFSGYSSRTTATPSWSIRST